MMETAPTKAEQGGKKMRMRWAAALLAAITWAPASSADPVADFYKGKQITLIVSYGPGGGYDVYARTLARHMPKYIPGNPTIIIQNMPGAGSLRGANYIYNAAPKDGTAFGTFARNIPLIGLLQKTNQNVQFDPLKFTWIGSSASFADDAYLLMVRRDAPVKSVADARKDGGPPIILGTTAEGVSSDTMGVVLREMLGFNVKQVPGYTDGAALNLAFERGEIEARNVGLSSIRSTKGDWVKPGGLGNVLMVFGRATRHGDFPNAPTARELAKNDADRRLIEILEVPYSLSRPFAAPPGVPEDRAKALVKAFMDTHKDPGYLEEAKKANFEVSPIDGAEVLRLIKVIADTPDDQLKSIEKLVEGG
jgi:tripartite-type tricarboxylate transporter receptor subunit TctC